MYSVCSRLGNLLFALRLLLSLHLPDTLIRHLLRSLSICFTPLSLRDLHFSDLSGCRCLRIFELPLGSLGLCVRHASLLRCLRRRTFEQQLVVSLLAQHHLDHRVLAHSQQRSFLPGLGVALHHLLQIKRIRPAPGLCLEVLLLGKECGLELLAHIQWNVKISALAVAGAPLCRRCSSRWHVLTRWIVIGAQPNACSLPVTVSWLPQQVCDRGPPVTELHTLAIRMLQLGEGESSWCLSTQ